MVEYDLIDTIALHFNGELSDLDFQKKINANVKNVLINKDESIKTISKLNSKGLVYLFSIDENSNIYKSLTKAFISFYNPDKFSKIFKSISNEVYVKIAKLWSVELLSLKPSELIELKYINSLMFTDLPSIISKYIDNRDRNKFDRQISNLRCFISEAAFNDEFIKVYVGDMSCELNDSSLDKDTHPDILSLKYESLLFKNLFEVSKLIVVGGKCTITFESPESFNNYFNDLIDLLEEIKNNSLEFKINLNDIDQYVIKLFKDGYLSSPKSFKDIISIKILNNDVKGDICKPKPMSKIVKKLNPLSFNKSSKNNKCDNLTFDDLMIESGKNSSGSKLKNYTIEFITIILVILSALGYFFKLSTINENLNPDVDSDYSYETSTGSEKTKIIIERVDPIE